MDRNYEKAYKAVLKTAQQWIEDGCSDKERICLESVFPELRESDDERIRKFLIEMFSHGTWQKEWPFGPNEIVAWLEKQKEPHFTKRNALFDKCVENCDPEIMKRVSDEVDEMLEKEQKPAEWSEEQPETFDSAAFQKGVQEGRRLEREDVLTVADIEKLHTFLYAVKNNKQGAFTFTRLSDEQYEEVLQRFNNAKEK